MVLNCKFLFTRNRALPQGFFDDEDKDLKARNIDKHALQQAKWDEFEKEMTKEAEVHIFGSDESFVVGSR